MMKICILAILLAILARRACHHRHCLRCWVLGHARPRKTRDVASDGIGGAFTDGLCPRCGHIVIDRCGTWKCGCDEGGLLPCMDWRRKAR